jgi:hypothetical protein
VLETVGRIHKPNTRATKELCPFCFTHPFHSAYFTRSAVEWAGFISTPMKSILLRFALFCVFAGSALAVQSIRQPFPELKLTDGRVLENARLKAFNEDSVFVRDDDGFVQVPYKLFPAELQPQLAKARAAAMAESSPIPDQGGVPPSEPATSRPVTALKPPFAHETLGAGNDCVVESVYFYDHFKEVCGADSWVRVLQWGAKENDEVVTGHAVAVFEWQGQLWAWDINFGFMPLDVPPESKENIALVMAPIVARYPNIQPYFPMYRQDFSQQPEANLPEVLATNDVQAIREATLAGARLGAHRPVNVLQFSCPDSSGAMQQSAAVAFIFNGQVLIYFPEIGTYRFRFPYLTVLNMQQLQWAVHRVIPGASGLHSLNYTGSAPVSADGQN